MKVNYKGMSSHYNYRIAEISYNEDNEKEKELAERIVFFLNQVKGWNINIGVSGWLSCEVEDMEEYKAFKQDYKKAKQMILNCMKYGF